MIQHQPIRRNVLSSLAALPHEGPGCQDQIRGRSRGSPLGHQRQVQIAGDGVDSSVRRLRRRAQPCRPRHPPRDIWADDVCIAGQNGRLRPGEFFFESGDINHTVFNKTNPMVHLLFEILPADLKGPSLIPVKHH